MGVIWVETENAFLVRYQKIRRLFKMYGNNELDRGNYEALKIQQLNLDDWKVTIYKLDDKQYNSIMIEALIDIYELYCDGAITKAEKEAEFYKVMLRPPTIKIPLDFFK